MNFPAKAIFNTSLTSFGFATDAKEKIRSGVTSLFSAIAAQLCKILTTLLTSPSEIAYNASILSSLGFKITSSSEIFSLI